MSYFSLGQTRPFSLTHPFKIDIHRKSTAESGTKYYLAANYHSRLYQGFKSNDKFLEYKNLYIEGLDNLKEVPATFPDKNFYCVLNITVQNLRATNAKIIWAEQPEDSSEQGGELSPIVFESAENKRQTEARIIIGAFVADDKSIAGLSTPDANDDMSAYIMQFVHSNLLLCNMVADGVPVLYPVAFAGGKLDKK